MNTFAALPALVFALCVPLPAANWPQFRGPNGNATSNDASVPLKWSATENLKWTAPLPGAGSSCPVIWGDRVFLTCFSGQGDNGDVSGLIRSVICFDKASGKKLWQKDFPAPQPEDAWQGMIKEHGYASNTPVTDGKSVFVQLGKGGVVALDFNGKELWRAATGMESNQRRWGSAGSLVLWKNLVIANASSEAHSIFAFDKDTGKQAWKQTAALLELAFGTPRLHQRKDGQDELLFAAPSELWAMNPENGKLRWFAEHGLSGNVTPDPVVVDDIVCIFGGYPGIGRVGLKMGDKGEVSASDIVWRDMTNSSYVPSPVAHDGKIYCVSDQGQAWCVDPKSGDVVYRERIGGSSGGGGQGGGPPKGGGAGGGRKGGGGGMGGGKPFYASPIVVNGNVVAVSRKQGTFVYPAKPQFSAPVVNNIEGDTTDFNATPAVSDGCLFLRSNKALYCIGK